MALLCCVYYWNWINKICWFRLTNDQLIWFVILNFRFLEILKSLKRFIFKVNLLYFLLFFRNLIARWLRLDYYLNQQITFPLFVFRFVQILMGFKRSVKTNDRLICFVLKIFCFVEILMSFKSFTFMINLFSDIF